MNIVLKSVKFSEALSEETNAFTADVWINGKKAGYARNDGRGGNTYIHAYPEQRELFKGAEQWLRDQPQINLGTEENPFLIDSNMESKVDELFEQWLYKKEQKKLENHCKRSLCYGNKNHYHIITWRNMTILQMLSYESSKARLKKVVDDLVGKGENILNTNLPEDWLN